MYKLKIEPTLLIGIGIFYLFCMMMIATHTYGVGITPDSVVYLSTAKNLYEHFSFVRFDGEALSNWAPLYSIILSLGYALHINIYWFAMLLNLIAIALTVFVSFSITKKFIDAKFQLGFVLIVCLSFPYYKLLITLYSESIFICFQAFFIYYFIKHIYTQSNKHLYLSAVFMALMCLQRYAGFMLLFVAVLILLTDDNIKSKIKSTVLFALISFLPIVPWLIKNYFVMGGFTGQHTFTGKLNPGNLGLNLYHILVYLQAHYALLFLYGTAIFFWGATLLFHQKNTTNMATKKAAKALWFYCSAYLFLLLMQKSLHLFEMARYISVLYVPLLCYMIMFIDEWYKKYAAEKNIVLYVRIFLIGISFMQISAITYHLIKTKNIGVGGYSIEWWHNKKLNEYVSTNLANKKVMSNYPDFLWLVNQKEYHFWQYKGETIEEYNSRNKGDEYVFWFKQPMRQTVVEPCDTCMNSNLQLIEDSRLYALYKVKSHSH